MLSIFLASLEHHKEVGRCFDFLEHCRIAVSSLGGDSFGEEKPVLWPCIAPYSSVFHDFFIGRTRSLRSLGLDPFLRWQHALSLLLDAEVCLEIQATSAAQHLWPASDNQGNMFYIPCCSYRQVLFLHAQQWRNIFRNKQIRQMILVYSEYILVILILH